MSSMSALAIDGSNRAMPLQTKAIRLKDAENKMRSYQVRRLPVVGADGRVVGVLALSDIAREAVRETDHKAPEVKPHEVAGTLAAICEPRTPQELTSAA